jgi:hypothetical protein
VVRGLYHSDHLSRQLRAGFVPYSSTACYDAADPLFAFGRFYYRDNKYDNSGCEHQNKKDKSGNSDIKKQIYIFHF